jgi:hypothetical protein
MRGLTLTVAALMTCSATAFADCPQAGSAESTPTEKVRDMVKSGPTTRARDGSTVKLAPDGGATPAENWFTMDQNAPPEGEAKREGKAAAQDGGSPQGNEPAGSAAGCR